MLKTIRNPMIAHRIVFLKTPEQTDGKLLRIEYGVEIPESKPAIPMHKHLKCTERFEVVSGQLGVILEGVQHILTAGEQIVIAPEAAHTFWNAGQTELRFITDVMPPGDLQTYWETVFGLAEDGKVTHTGLPNLLQLAVVVQLADSYDPNIPVPITNLFITVLGLIGRLLGYKAKYPQYSS